MLTESQLEFFHAFGYIALDPDSFADTMVHLHSEVADAIATAYPDEQNGTMLLPAMADSTPYSLSLVHDERLLDTAARLLGDNVILKVPKITSFGKRTNWHRDCYMKLRGIKVVVYFAEAAEGAIPFDIIPASHSGAVRTYVDRLFGAEQSRQPSVHNRNPSRALPPVVPSSTLSLEPRQVLIFDLGLWHANLSLHRRLQWAATYLAAPRTAKEVRDTVSHLGEFFEYERPYPRELFPYFPPSWEKGDGSSPLLRAMKDTGVLDAYLNTFGPGR